MTTVDWAVLVHSLVCVLVLVLASVIDWERILVCVELLTVDRAVPVFMAMIR
jgi:hypothetical protein